MKINSNILLLILLIINLNSFASKNELTDIFNIGNTAYKNADYSLAVEKYKSIINKGFVNYQVYFNLGNSYFKLKDYPSAILYYEKAYKLNAADEDIKHNLKLANKNITDKIEPVPDFFMKKLWLNLLLSFKIDTWAFLSLLFLFFGLALFIIFIVFNNIVIKKIGFYTACISLFGGILSFILAYQQKSFLTESNSAIIFEESLTVKSAPDEKSTQLFVIHEGTKVKIIDSLGEWNKVKIENGNIGWIKSTTFQKI